MPSISISVRVPFADVDSSGRIHFTAMLRYMENAEHELVRSLGFPRATTFPDVVFPRVHVECDLRRAIRYDDELTVTAWVERVGRSSWTIAFSAYFTQEVNTTVQDNAPPSAETVAEGKMTIVSVDPKTERARTLPDHLRRALTADQ